MVNAGKKLTGIFCKYFDVSIYLLTIFTRLDIFSISSEQIRNTRALPKSRIQLHLGSEDW